MRLLSVTLSVFSFLVVGCSTQGTSLDKNTVTSLLSKACEDDPAVHGLVECTIANCEGSPDTPSTEILACMEENCADEYAALSDTCETCLTDNAGDDTAVGEVIDICFGDFDQLAEPVIAGLAKPCTGDGALKGVRDCAKFECGAKNNSPSRAIWECTKSLCKGEVKALTSSCESCLEGNASPNKTVASVVGICYGSLAVKEEPTAFAKACAGDSAVLPLRACTKTQCGVDENAKSADAVACMKAKCSAEYDALGDVCEGCIDDNVGDGITIGEVVTECFGELPSVKTPVFSAAECAEDPGVPALHGCAADKCEATAESKSSDVVKCLLKECPKEYDDLTVSCGACIEENSGDNVPMGDVVATCFGELDVKTPVLSLSKPCEGDAGVGPLHHCVVADCSATHETPSLEALACMETTCETAFDALTDVCETCIVEHSVDGVTVGGVVENMLWTARRQPIT